jgi:hypothetical protein
MTIERGGIDIKRLAMKKRFRAAAAIGRGAYFRHRNPVDTIAGRTNH